MIKEPRLEELLLSELLAKTKTMFEEGYRLAQIGCTKTATHFELTYSFDKALEFVTYKLKISIDQPDEIPSISAIYPNAFLYENEIHDLFGLTITHISIDFQGSFYHTSIKTPFNVPTPTEEGKPTL